MRRPTQETPLIAAGGSDGDTSPVGATTSLQAAQLGVRRRRGNEARRGTPAPRERCHEEAIGARRSAASVVGSRRADHETLPAERTTDAVVRVTHA